VPLEGQSFLAGKERRAGGVRQPPAIPLLSDSVSVEERVAVGERFTINPPSGGEQREQFYVLAVSQNDIRLLYCQRVQLS